MNKGALVFGGLGLAAAAVAAFFVLGGPSTGTLAVSVSAAGGKAIDGVTVSVDGAEACQDSICKVEDLEKGSYKVSAKATGFVESAPKLVSVKAGEDSVINIELTPESAGTGLKVSSRGAGLSLKVDGKEIGPLPQELKDLKPGSHKIEVGGSPFFKPFSETIDIKDDEILAFEPDLKLDKGQVVIALGDNADGAQIFLVGDGKRFPVHKKKLPLKIDIPADKEFKIIATKKGFNDYEQSVEFTVEEPQKTYEVTLIDEDEDAAPVSPVARTTPRPSAPAAPAPAQAQAPAPAPAASGTAKLNINSIPVSTVILDGRPLGTTPKVGVSVSPGTHTVMFVHPEHGRKSRTVTVGAGATATAAVRFP